MQGAKKGQIMAIPPVVACGFDHSAAIGQDNELYMWGTLTNYRIEALENWEENIINKVPIIHNNKAYIPLSVSCGNQYTMIVCKQKRRMGGAIGSQVYDEENIGMKLPTSAPKPSMDSRKQDFEHFYNYLKRILDIDLKPSRGGSKGSGRKLYTNLYEILREDDPYDGEEYIPDNNNLKGFESPIHYENYEISKKSFKIRMNELLDSENEEIKRINDFYGIKQEHIDKLAEELCEGSKTLDIGELDCKIYKVDKSQGVVFGIGCADPTIFNYYPRNTVEEDEPDSYRSHKSSENRKVTKTIPSEDLMRVKKFRMISFPKTCKPIRSVACGTDHAMALTVDGEMYYWGRDLFYENMPSKLKPEKLIMPHEIEIYENGYKQRIIEIDCGYSHCMCITEHYILYTWGNGDSGRLGHGDNQSQKDPKIVQDLIEEKIIKISAGEKHSACINSRFQVFTWGCHSNGKLGFDSNEEARSPVRLEDLLDREFIHVSCGAMHTLLTTIHNEVIAFGHGKDGKLGDGTEEDSFFPTKASFEDDYVKIESTIAGYNISVALDYTDGAIYTWGYSGRGILGRTDVTYGRIPRRVGVELIKKNYMKSISKGECRRELEFPTGIYKIAIGATNTLVLTDTGIIFVYGNDDHGQFGATIENKEDRKKELNRRKKDVLRVLEFLSRPFQCTIPISNKVMIVDVAVGSHHVLALSSFTDVYTWGRNDDGQLGHGFVTPKIEIPTVVQALRKERVKAVFATENYSACLSYFGELFTCGNGEFGKLGNDVPNDIQSEFELVELESPIVKVGLGIHHMAVICDYDANDITNKDGKTMVWGRNHKGQLGIGSKDQVTKPEELTKLNYLNTRLIDIQCGLSFTLGLTKDLNLMFFGDKEYCLTGEVTEDVLEPIILEDANREIDKISVCYNKTLVKTTKGEVYEYGYFLKSADSTSGPKASSGMKVDLPSDALIKDICSGPYHCSIFTMGNEMYSWGFDRMGSTGLPIKIQQYQKRKNRRVKDPRPIELLSKQFEENKEKNRLLNDNEDVYDDKKRGATRGARIPTETDLVHEEEKKIIPDEETPKEVTREEKQEATKVATRDYFKRKNKATRGPVSERDVDMFWGFVKKSKVRILSISKTNRFQGLSRYLIDERDHGCDEMSIIRMNKKLMKYLDIILGIVKTCIEMYLYKQKNEFKIESAFISRVSVKPFNISRREITDLKRGSEYERLKDIMTALYIHPCYINNIIKNELMTDDEIYDFITELYESNSHLKVGYLTSYTLTALERDIANGEHDASKLNLKKVPSKSIIKIETDKKRAKNKRKNKASRKGKAKRAEAEKEEGKIEDFSDDDEERQAEDRPECLFYRLWKFILHDCAGVKYFLHLVCVYMINRVFTDKAFLDQDDYGADDNNNVQNEASMLKRRDGILAFVDDLFKKFREDTLDVPDPSQRKFEMPKINSRIYNAYEFKKSSKNKEEIKGEDNKEAYEATMPYEMIYFIQKIVEILKLRYPNESKGYIMYSKVLELFFEDIMDILRDFKIQLTPYVRDMDSFRKIKADLQKFHLYNLENIFEVFISTIGYRDPFEKVDYHPYKDLFEEVKSSLKREARSRIDDLYFNFVDKIKGYKPELDLFKKLVVHSFDHKGVKINVSIDKFIKFHYLCVKSPKLIFGREESDFDFVSSTLSKIKHIVYYENIKARYRCYILGEKS
ncbi:unnamed protein product [Moneuplotes crassus]|uniref:RCC1-like domain-containing protein n=1 Tax=Euplotes crassus TaxID=5936 RepID=A0AAD2D2M7_EUPCR|nr:unnamed protein product [Moneuplotes crassus]